MKVGVIGYGYVGKAVASSYDVEQVLINDPTHAESTSIDTMKAECRGIFVCVPTPQGATGECDTSILESIFEQLHGYTGLVICKSTASPQVYTFLERTSGLRLAHVPEFLTQANAVNDYLKPNKIVIGCDHKLWNEVADFVITDKMTVTCNIDCCTIGEASFFKYLANTQLAMKVVINNEFYNLAEQMGLRWDVISAIAQSDKRLGNTHWAVPGPDGTRGYGGMCFPKDTAALAALAEDLGVDMSMLNQAIIRNIELRSKH
jgi:UDPglucose 6-dehydrogenase